MKNWFHKIIARHFPLSFILSPFWGRGKGEGACIRFIFTAVIAGALVSGCSTIRKSPNFEKRSQQIKTVVVVQPEMSIERWVFKGTNEAMYEESKHSSEALSKAIVTEMKNRGYETRLLEITDVDLQKDPGLKQELSRLKDKYNSVTGDVNKQYVSKMKWKNFNLSLGSDVNVFADKTGADVLIFAAGGGFVKSGGEIANDVAKTLLIGAASLGSVIYVAPSYGGYIVVSVVDGDNGELLWHNFSNAAQQYNVTKEDVIQKMTKGVLKKFPNRAAPLASKRDPAVSPLVPGASAPAAPAQVPATPAAAVPPPALPAAA